MITLLTGVPGTGKTAYAVQLLRDAAEVQGRPIYTNITGLKLPHFSIDNDWLRNWHRNAPPGAFILFDECQHVFPPRHISKESPDYVLELTEHRKKYSVDFFLITQGANLIDFGVKSLVSRYLHIREDGLLPMIYEAREIVDFKDKSVRETHAGKPYTPPKDVFDLYVSAELHNKKPRRKLPNAVYFFGLAAALAIGLGVYVYQTRFSSPPEQIASVYGERGAALAAQAPATETPLLPVPNRIVEALTPTDDHNPLSAPLYAAVVPPVVAPEVVGCIASKTRCSCYSQQQTPVWLPDEQCRQRAAGLYFDPYRQPPDDKTHPQPVNAQSSPGGLAGGFEDGPPA